MVREEGKGKLSTIKSSLCILKKTKKGERSGEERPESAVRVKAEIDGVRNGEFSRHCSLVAGGWWGGGRIVCVV